ncbi:unnamed protein product [Parajaminaea phylloscopi]
MLRVAWASTSARAVGVGLQARRQCYQACRDYSQDHSRHKAPSSPDPETDASGKEPPSDSSHLKGPLPPLSASSPNSATSGSSPTSPLLSRLRERVASHRAQFEPQVRSELARLGSRWNTWSGYDLIAQAKDKVREAEEGLSAVRQHQGQVRERYLATVEQRATSQRTINDLLSRKASWSDQDLIQYTSLLRAEHGESRAEEEARDRFDAAEREVARAWDNVVKRTLERYHDEQVWSDRVRNVSSYTQLAAVGLNMVIFLLAILLVEPYKRRRLAETFESRLVKGEEQGRLALEGVIAQFDKRVEELAQGLDGISRGQRDIMAAAGIRLGDAGPGQEGSVHSAPTDSTQDTPPLMDESDPSEASSLLDRARKETNFLHSPRTEPERQQQRIAGIAAAVGSLVGGLIVALASTASK